MPHFSILGTLQDEMSVASREVDSLVFVGIVVVVSLACIVRREWLPCSLEVLENVVGPSGLGASLTSLSIELHVSCEIPS